MGAVWYRARRASRRRWAATCVVVLLVGVAGGVVLTAVAGARRSSTAYDRFRAATLAADLDVAFESPPDEGLDARAAEIAQLPQVEVLTRTAFPFVVPAGSGLYPYLDFLAIVGLDDRFANDVDRPRLVSGRFPDPQRADEIAVLQSYARDAELQVGDRARFDSYAPEQLEPLFTGGDVGPPSGPQFEFVVTGVLDAPTFVSESSGSFTPKMFMSRAFVETHGEEIATYPGGFTLRLRDGARDVPAVSQALREMFDGEAGLELSPSGEVDRKVEESIRVVVVAILLFALIAALAACVAIAQALSRHFSQDAVNAGALSALGMTRVARAGTLTATAVPIAIGGAVLAVFLAALASPLMPLGVARRAEPDRGLSFDGAVLAGGGMCIAVLVMLFAVIAAVPLAHERAGAGGRVFARHPSRLMRALRQRSRRPQISIGMGFALDPRDGTVLPVRSAIAGVAFGAAGVAAMMVFAASLTTLAESPNRYGAPWDALVYGFTSDVGEDVVSEIVVDDDAARVGRLATGIGRIDDEEINVHSIASLKGSATFTLLDGRLPTGFAEVALGSETLRAAGLDIGGDVEIVGAEGDATATIVGRVALPIIDERSAVDRGALMTDEQLMQVITADERSEDLLVDWRSGTEVSAANEALGARLDTEVFEPRMPSEVNNLRAVDALPRALAIFLTLLAIVATTHALVQTTRLRRHELAVLRSLGFERQQLSTTVAVQATTIALIGTALGVPLGIVAGRLLWQSIANRVGVVDGVAMPLFALVALAVAITVIANVAAIIPARRAGGVNAENLFHTPWA